MKRFQTKRPREGRKELHAWINSRSPDKAMGVSLDPRSSEQAKCSHNSDCSNLETKQIRRFTCKAELPTSFMMRRRRKVEVLLLTLEEESSGVKT